MFDMDENLRKMIARLKELESEGVARPDAVALLWGVALIDLGDKIHILASAVRA
ncbi:MAG: hypothetical protein V3S55_15585 [Nitrospiraceae bacterium]